MVADTRFQDVTAKNTIVSADKVILIDSQDSNKLKQTPATAFVGPTGATGATGAAGTNGTNGTNGTGDVNGPATNTDSYIPQWDGVNSKTLKNGIPMSTFAPSLGSDDNYVTDAQLAIIQNTSGTNTGDNATNSQYSGLATSKQDALGFTPENVANKSTTLDTDKASNTKYPSVKSVYDWAVALFANIAGSITQTFGASTIELGHASDTTLSRVSAGKTAVEGVNQGTEGILQNSQSAAYTTVLTDAGKHIYHPSADTTARTFTIDSNANVAYPIGTAITFINDISAGVVTIAITSDTLLWEKTGATGSRTLAANSIATAIKITSTKWLISGSTGLT